MKLSTTQTLGPLVIEAGYFSGNNLGAIELSLLEILDGCNFLTVFSVSILRVCLSVGIDFDWKRNRNKGGR